MSKMTKKRFIVILVSVCAITAALTYTFLSAVGASARARKEARYTEPDYIRYAAQGYTFDSVSNKTNILLTVTDSSSPVRLHLFTIDEDKQTLDILDIPPLCYTVADGFSGTLISAYDTGVYRQIVSQALAVKIDYQFDMSADALSTVCELLGETNAYLRKSLTAVELSFKKGDVTFDKVLAKDVILLTDAYSNEDTVYIYHAFLSSLINKFGDLGTIESVSKLTSLLLNSVDTDMSVSDMIELASASSKIKFKKINIHLIPGEICEYNGETVYSAHIDDVAELLNKSFRIKGGEIGADKLGAKEIVNSGVNYNLPNQINQYIK